MIKRKALVRASDIGKAAYCPHAMCLAKRDSAGRPATSSLMARGTSMHEELTDRVVGASDRRCYIASYAFGIDHPTTVALRDWRDRALLPTRRGRFVVRMYYRLSPTVIDLCRKWDWMDRLVNAMLLSFLRRVAIKPVAQTVEPDQSSETKQDLIPRI